MAEYPCSSVELAPACRRQVDFLDIGMKRPAKMAIQEKCPIRYSPSSPRPYKLHQKKRRILKFPPSSSDRSPYERARQEYAAPGNLAADFLQLIDIAGF